MTKQFKSFVSDESGATAIEYGLIAALVAVAAITAFRFVGTEVTAIFNTVGNTLKAAH